MTDKYDRHWEDFPSHTRLKHAILRAYLGAWARILLNKGRHETIWFVDGFAGRGRDEKGNPGSPLIACSIADELHHELQKKGISGRMRIVAVEWKAENFRALRDNVADSACHPALYHDSINERYSTILAMIGDAPAFFFLDPWGVEGLSAEMIEHMLNGERREVLVLFSEHGTHRLAAAVNAKPEDRLVQPSLFENDDAEISSKGARSDYREADEAILQDVFAGLWILVEDTAAHNPGMEKQSYLDSYVAIQERLGARYVLPMSIIDENDHHHYSLVHASKNGKAVVAMKEALNSAMNKRARELGPALLENFRFASPGLSRVCDQIAEYFAGRDARWDEKGSTRTVRRYALEETWALVPDLSEIKSILTKRGYVIKKKPLTLRFPSRLGDRSTRE